MEQTIKIVKMEVASGDLNTLLQRYTMVLNTKNSKVYCQKRYCRSRFKLIEDKLYETTYETLENVSRA